jgi:hypothetical protein
MARMEAHPDEEKPASVDMKPEAAQQQEEVPVKDATVIPVRDPEDGTTSNARKEKMACQEMEERLDEEKPTSVDRKPEAAEEEEEVPVEDAVVKPVNGQKRRHRGKKQTAERCEEPEERTREICVSRRKLAARAVRYPVEQQWYDVGEMPSRTNGPRMGAKEDWPPPAEERVTVRKWYGK